MNELHIPVLQSAIFRALRLSGQSDRLEEQLSRVNDAWLAIKCIQERSRCGNRDSGLVTRLKSRLSSTSCAGNARLERVIDEICGPPAILSPPSQTLAPTNEGTTCVTSLMYDDVVAILSAPRSDFKPTSQIILTAMTKEQCERLIMLADPANDRTKMGETFKAGIQFTQDGHLVGRRSVTYSQSPNASIRPAVAAANRFKLPNPWHHELMTGVSAPTYITGYLASLGTLDDPDRFYEELEDYDDVLFVYLCDAQRVKPVLKYIDARIVPYLDRYLSSGADEFFEGLCTLATCVTTPDIDGVLAGLLYRWTHRFDIQSQVIQHDENHPLWRGFKRLTAHPRFESIDGWQTYLATVLGSRLFWYHAEEVVRVIERSPRSYALIELRLFKEANWQHRPHDEIDRLDAAAERLFSQTLEE